MTSKRRIREKVKQANKSNSGRDFRARYYVEPTGEYVTVKRTEYFCLTEKRWTDCPGPCPDGKVHAPQRTVEHPRCVLS